jgi:hypothetical protein
MAVVLVQNDEAALATAIMATPSPTLDLFKGRHFNQEIMMLCVRWHLSFQRFWCKWVLSVLFRHVNCVITPGLSSSGETTHWADAGFQTAEVLAS